MRYGGFYSAMEWFSGVPTIILFTREEIPGRRLIAFVITTVL
jgi:hypothetical protein